MATSATESQCRAGRGKSASMTVVEAVGAAADTPVLELPPLFDAIDPDALDALFAGRPTNGVVTFRYAGYDVTVRADGTVELSDAD